MAFGVVLANIYYKTQLKIIRAIHLHPPQPWGLLGHAWTILVDIADLLAGESDLKEDSSETE